jgi:hypothetical protein
MPPLMDVDFELLSDDEFRLLLEALHFGARYYPQGEEAGCICDSDAGDPQARGAEVGAPDI